MLKLQSKINKKYTSHLYWMKMLVKLHSTLVFRNFHFPINYSIRELVNSCQKARAVEKIFDRRWPVMLTMSHRRQIVAHYNPPSTIIASFLFHLTPPYKMSHSPFTQSKLLSSKIMNKLRKYSINWNELDQLLEQ